MTFFKWVDRKIYRYRRINPGVKLLDQQNGFKVYEFFDYEIFKQ